MLAAALALTPSTPAASRLKFALPSQQESKHNLEHAYLLTRAGNLFPMADPISIAGLSLQVAQILGPVVKALWRAYRDGKTVHESLKDLHSDLDALYELTINIHHLFSLPRFLADVRSVKNDTNVEVMSSLDRSLEGCSKEAQGLLNILGELGLQTWEGLLRQAQAQWRLNRKIDRIDRLKRNFRDHKSTMQLAFQLLNT